MRPTTSRSWSSASTTEVGAGDGRVEPVPPQPHRVGRSADGGVGEPPRIREEHAMKKTIGILAVVATVSLIGLAAKKRSS